jgi:nicotinate phosphoribosyltransferase
MALFTDFYELTMARAYQAQGMDQTAVFEVFFRRMPEKRNFILAAGLADVLDYLESWRFTESDLAYLAGLGQFPDDFLHHLAGLRFKGDVYAVPEGTVVFPNEPLVQIVAPISQAQILETFVLNQVNFQSVVASKAARLILAAQGRTVVDFGSRRAHGLDGAVKAARASYLAGAAGTSNVQAAKLYGMPAMGTMAHSYVQAHGNETQAFANFIQVFPETTLLVDTYDTMRGVAEVIDLAKRLGPAFKARGIRLDSGDMADLAKRSRNLLDAAGLNQMSIFASSELDEFKVRALLEAGAPIDGFGVGTSLVVSSDAPSLDMVYKLVDYAGVGRAKLCSSKAMYPGRKQVRRFSASGVLSHDVVCRHNEELGGEVLLEPVMSQGQRTPAGKVSLNSSRERAAFELARLPQHLRCLETSPRPYPVKHSPALERDLEQLRLTQATGCPPAVG